ncbi:MAG: sensor histidine kinase [Spirochaetia bacterium]|nr:sensor histidine kinase [Spirochaetia bacterium]NCC89697.1 sensor histidine kinase [Spirochaetia bacterium]
MDTKEHIRHPRIIWLTTASIIIGLILIFLLSSLLNKYSDNMIESQKATYSNIVKNIAISIENEVSQTEQSLQFFVNTKDFNDALVTFKEEERSWPLNQISLLFCVYYSQVIENMLISTTEQLSSSFWSLKKKNYTRAALVSQNEFATIDIYLEKENPSHSYLGITVSNTDGNFVTAMLDLDLMYQRLISHMKIDIGTDILVNNSNGLILMSSNAGIVGKDAYEVYRDLVEGKQGDPEELLSILSHQGERKEGSESFVGYWLYDETQTPSQKLSVYVPANIDAGFLVISAIIDYQKVIQPLQQMYVSISALVIAIVLVFIGLIVFLYITSKHKEEMEKENRFLRELNQTLQCVNENQRLKNHQQRLEIIGTMTCGIAHEFNNLLTPIMGYSGMLLAQKTEQDSEYEDVKEIFEASEKAKEIIQQISAFGRINSDMTYHQVSVTQFITQVTKLAQGLMPAHVRFLSSLPEQEYYLFGNTTQLTQVVLNLIVNGIDAIGKQEGVITLSFHLDHSYSDESGSPFGGASTKTYGCLHISDNGCGMDEETQKHIFKPFYTTKSKQGGSGLGLIISENIIHAHHGKILVSSQPQKGSEFILLLPITNKPMETPPALSLPSLKKKQETIADVLIINTDASILKLFAKGLTKQGYQVTKIQDRFDALEILELHTYQVLVTDDSMEQVSWSDLVMKARSMTPALVIILLASTITKEVIDAVSTGIIDGFLLKPVSISELEEKMLDVLKY